MTPTPIFALTTRGLESVTADELAAFGISESAISYRRVSATVSDLAPLLNLRTDDDIFLHVATWPSIGRPREALAKLTAFARQLDLRPLAKLCSSVRSLPTTPSFAITASFVGKRNYSSDEMKEALHPALSASHHWKYCERDEDADLNVRLFVEQDIATVGVRLGKRPLQERWYKCADIPGSLKPPIAAALLKLIDVKSGMRFVDPCCGAGTIAIEAWMMGAKACGGDIAPESIAAARSNAQAAGASIDFEPWDIAELPLADASIDRIAVNLPWDRQVAVDSLSEFYRQACLQMRRVLAPGGRIAVLTTAPERISFPDLRQERAIEISVSGQRPTILTFAAD